MLLRIWTLTLLVLSISALCSAQEEFKGENVCSYRKYAARPIHIRQKYERPVHTLNLKKCREEGESPCNRTIITYRTTFRSVLRMRVKAITVPGCCRGWKKRSPHDISCLQSECSRSCENGGECIGHEHCQCPEGFTGAYCHVDIDECTTAGRNPCQQKCINTPGSFKCSCIDELKVLETRVDSVHELAEDGITSLKASQLALAGDLESAEERWQRSSMAASQIQSEAIESLKNKQDQMLARIEALEKENVSQNFNIYIL
ncbi:epidermal growth factor protein 7 [Elysia marginata]|uniref:Epidermal growth factor protein 7 n=1 Tax=Elysia marginata TaxID=1093978 RepID=A0AAV4HJ95_9GAST|nr:epidermal growth factor protein 7 [Elysia marginata]